MILVSLACLLQFGRGDNGAEGELLRRILHHPAFRSYSCQELDRATMVATISKKLRVDESLVASMLLEAASSCELDQELLSSLQSTKEQLVGWVDIPAEEWQQVYSLFPQSLWQNFARVSTGSILEKSTEVLIIDKCEETALLHSFQGFQAIPYASSTKKAWQKYLKRRFFLRRAVEKGLKQLKEAVTSKGLKSTFEYVSGKRELVDEIFSPCMAMCCLPETIPSDWKASLQELVESGQPFGYFGDDLSRYPADIDTMSFCVSTLLDLRLIGPDQATNFLEICLRNTNDQNELLTYLDPERPRIDPVVLANVLYLAYTLSMEDHPVVRHNESLVQKYLFSGSFLYGSRYYVAQEDFLFTYGRVVTKFGEKGRIPNFDRVYQAMQSALVNRIGNETESKPLDVARRVLLSRHFGIQNTADVDLLLEMQNEDGTWPLQVLSNLPSSKGGVFNSVVDFSFAVKALQSHEKSWRA